MSVIDQALARRLVDSQFPQWSHLPVTPVELDGWDNRTFRLGDELTVRLPSGDGYVGQVEKEQRWLPVLAPHLPLPIPAPVAKGDHDGGYPLPWSVYRWLDGELALDRTHRRPARFRDRRWPASSALAASTRRGGPAPGPHNFYRGGPLTIYDGEALEAIDALGERDPRRCGQAGLGDALAASWARAGVVPRRRRDREPARPRRPPAAVIDFGTSGVGDPACDLAIAWTFLSGASRTSSAPSSA